MPRGGPSSKEERQPYPSLPWVFDLQEACGRPNGWDYEPWFLGLSIDETIEQVCRLLTPGLTPCCGSASRSFVALQREERDLTVLLSCRVEAT